MTFALVHSAHSVRKIPWIPNQKGAWAMVILPYWTGAVAAGFRLEHILVFSFYLAGYSLFFTGENCLRARCSQAYLRPVQIWCAATAVLAAAVILWCGALCVWIPWFFPFIGVAVWQAFKRKNRSLLARTAEVCAAGLMCAVAWDIGVRHEISVFSIDELSDVWGNFCRYSLFTSSSFSSALICTALFIFYFWSTIPYVKSLVREKRSKIYKTLSLGAQAVGVIISALVWIFDLAGVQVLILWIVLFARAIVFTYVAHRSDGHIRHQKMSSKKLLIYVGAAETVLSIIYAAVLLFAVA